MPNSDNTYGTFNKSTREYKIYKGFDNSVVSQSFGGNVETAKNHFFTDEALACWNNNSTQIEWAITSDGNGIKVTNAFGTKGSSDQDAASDWAATWTSTKNSLLAANNWIKSSALNDNTYYWKMDTSEEHLF